MLRITEDMLPQKNMTVKNPVRIPQINGRVSRYPKTSPMDVQAMLFGPGVKDAINIKIMAGIISEDIMKPILS